MHHYTNMYWRFLKQSLLFCQNVKPSMAPHVSPQMWYVAVYVCEYNNHKNAP